VGTAAVAPTGDPNTGIYFPAADQVGITTGGSAAAIFAAGAISNPTITGVATFAAGSAGAPAITTTGDTNTGIFFPAADTVAIAEGGVEALRVDSSGRLLIGASTARANLFNSTSTSALQVEGTGFDTSSVLVTRNTNSSASAYLVLARSRSTAVGGTTILQAGDRVGAVSMQASDGDQFVEVSRIEAYVNNTPAANNIAGRLTFNLTADGSTTLVERFSLDSNGLITGTGTSLGAWTAYTPTLGGTGWALGDGTSAGSYCQIGKVVHFRGQIVFGSTSTFGAGALTISLPVTRRSVAGSPQVDIRLSDASVSKPYSAVAILGSGATTFTPNAYVSSTAGEVNGGLTTSDPFTWASSDVIFFAGTYEAA
jgi:hypothetical protein